MKCFRPMFVPEKYKNLIKDYVECHCPKKQGYVVSVKISFLKMCDLIEFYYLKKITAFQFRIREGLLSL